MVKLAKTFSKNGYEYTQLDRTDKAAIYIQKVEKDCNGIVGEKVGFEVFLIGKTKAYSLTAKPTKSYKKGDVLKVYNYPEAESIPGNEKWGLLGWTYNTQASALLKFNEIK